MKKTVWQIDYVSHANLSEARNNFSQKENEFMERKIFEFIYNLSTLRHSIPIEQLALIEKCLRDGYVLAHMQYIEELTDK